MCGEVCACENMRKHIPRVGLYKRACVCTSGSTYMRVGGVDECEHVCVCAGSVNTWGTCMVPCELVYVCRRLCVRVCVYPCTCALWLL